MKKFFITGTDTEVGKTITSAIFMLALEGCYWKPIQTGIADEVSDRDQVKKLTGLPDAHFLPSNYLLKASLSPNQAAQLEKTNIDIMQCKLPNTNHSLIVEGIGGVFVPLNDDVTVCDLMQKLNLPIIIVCRGTLGTINHTLLTIETLRQRNLPIHGIVFSGDLNSKNQITIEKWGQVKTLLHIPKFEKITKEILKSWVNESKPTILEALT